MKTYLIPRDSRTQAEYSDYAASLPWVWFDSPSLNIDYQAETVSVNATLAGYTPIPPPAVPVDPTRFVDKDVFIERFTPTEYAAIRALRSTNATIDWLMAVLDAKSGGVNLASPRLVSGLLYIESLPNSPLASGRAAQITGA